MSKKILLDAPNVGKLEKRYLEKAIDSGFVSTIGPFVSNFENRFAAYVGALKAVSTQSGTAAIHRALYDIGIGKGDEVIVPALTFVATVNPILYVGAVPRFADVDKKTWTISAEEIKKHITSRTRAILPVHLYGNPCNMSAIMKLAREHDLYVVEDATESLGAFYGKKHTGLFGDFGCFSFNGNKVITTGGGGMVVGRDKIRLEHIKFLANQAKHTYREHYHPEIGFNERMTNIEAALGLAQMDRLPGFIKLKSKFHEVYRNELDGFCGIRFQEEYPGAVSSWWLTCMTLGDGYDVVSVQEKLKKHSIPTRRIFMPLVESPPYKRYKKEKYKNSYEIYNRGLCLPGSTLNTVDDIYTVSMVIKKCLGMERSKRNNRG